MKIGFDFDGILSRIPLRKILYFVGRPLREAYRKVIITASPNRWTHELILNLRAKGHEVVIITGRPEVFKSETREWLANHGLAHLKVYHNPQPDFSTKQQIVHKKRSIGRLGVKVYVEDQPKVAKGIAQMGGVEVVLHTGKPQETVKDVWDAISDVKKKNPESLRTYATREGKTALREIQIGDLLEVYYPVTGNFFRAKMLTMPIDKEGIWHTTILDKNGERQKAVWNGRYFVLGDVESNPPPQIVISVPHAVGIPTATGSMKGHDYIAKEMALKLAERLGVPSAHVVMGDVPRDVLDLNRERSRWKTEFRRRLRELIRRHPGDTIHLDVHSFRVNSKVYAGNDVAIATTEKRARPHELALRDYLIANGLRSRIYTEMLMDVVPEGRELGVPVSYLIEFNEGLSAEQKDHYADLVSIFIKKAVSMWPPTWPSVSAEAGTPRESEPQANPPLEEVTPWRQPVEEMPFWWRVKYALLGVANPQGPLRTPTQAEREHEEQRIQQMSMRELRTRLGRMAIPQKLFAFLLALDEAEMPELANEVRVKLASLGYDGEGNLITQPRRPERPREQHPAEAAAWNQLHFEPRTQIFYRMEHYPPLDEIVAYSRSSWAGLPETIKERLIERYGVVWDDSGVRPLTATHPLSSPVPYVQPYLHNWRNLRVGDLVEIPLELNRDGSEDRFTVVYHIGLIRDEDERDGYHGEGDQSVWGIWQAGPEHAKTKYLNATEGDLRPFIPGLLKHNSREEAIYRILERGISRTPDDNIVNITRLLEEQGVPVKDGDAELYYAVPDTLTLPTTILEPNVPVQHGDAIILSTHPEIGLYVGNGQILQVKVPIGHLSVQRIYPHRVDFMLGAPDDAWPIEPVNILGEPFNVRAVGVVRHNPECVLCSDLQTPKVYYEDPFIVICDDIKHEKSIMAMIKRHAKEPEEWERKWLMRVLNYTAGEAFPTEYEIRQTMNTEPDHWHIHAVGNPHHAPRSAMQIIESVQ